jgi:hypothetical protein
MQRILVCGGRHVDHKHPYAYQNVSQIISNHIINWTEPDDEGNQLPIAHIIHGGAIGVDTLADKYAIDNWLTVDVYKADWEQYGKAAGPIRNQRMLDEGQPDMIIAINPGRGTRDMIARGRKADIPVHVYEYGIDIYLP